MVLVPGCVASKDFGQQIFFLSINTNMQKINTEKTQNFVAGFCLISFCCILETIDLFFNYFRFDFESFFC